MKFTHYTTVAIIGLASPAIAGSCSQFFPPTPCGEVQNNSKHTLKYTYLFEDNRKGGNTVKNAQVSCDQKDLGKGGHKGGGNKDVDGFTFADREYVVQVRGAKSRTIKKGVWTKVRNNELATCWDDAILGKVGCTVELDA
jgi:hypothetical protein